MDCQICKSDKYTPLTFIDCICCFGKKKLKTIKCSKSNCQFYYHKECAYNHVLGLKTLNYQNPYKCPMKCDTNLDVDVPYNSFDQMRKEITSEKHRKYTLQKHRLAIIFYVIMCCTFDIYYIVKRCPSMVIYLLWLLLLFILPSYHCVYLVNNYGQSVTFEESILKPLNDKILTILTIFQYLCKIGIMIPVILKDTNLINIPNSYDYIVPIACIMTFSHLIIAFSCSIIGGIGMLIAVIIDYTVWECIIPCCSKIYNLRSNLRKIREADSEIDTTRLIRIEPDDVISKNYKTIP